MPGSPNDRATPSAVAPHHRHFILATAGHIDHGKSSLVNALTGTDPDRLPEEKSRGMTIELGFAHLAFDDPDPPPDSPGTRFELGIVDVPGHADFIRNMVAGVGSIDVALFVVAADDSWMPQSEEHLQILTYLGVRRGVIALTKADLAEDLDFVTEDLRIYLGGTFLENAPVVPTNAPGGQGLGELRAALASTLRDTPPPRDYGKPRLPVDRVFSPTGVGTVVTGTLTGGALATGDAVTVQPGGTPAKIRKIQNHKQTVDSIPPGTRTALNIPDAPVATRAKKSGAHRSDTVAPAGLGEPSITLDVVVTKSDREIPNQPGSLRPIKDGQKVRFHHGSADFGGRLFFASTKKLNPGESAVAELRLDHPAYVFAFDSFVLRDWGKASTIGGGTVLDPNASPRRFRKPHQQAFLASTAPLATPETGTPTTGERLDTFVTALLTRDHALDRSKLDQTPFGEAEISSATDRLASSGTAVTRGPHLIDATWWQETLDSASSSIRDHHDSNPDRTAISAASLRSKTQAATHLDPQLFDQLVADLTASGQFVKTPSGLRAHDHLPSLPPDLQPLRASILKTLAENPIDPPNPKEFITTPNHQKVLRFLFETGEAIDLDEKCAILPDAYHALVTQVTDHITTHGQATASDLRSATNTTRRILIPLLERLDTQGVTFRNGDLRGLKKNRE